MLNQFLEEEMQVKIVMKCQRRSAENTTVSIKDQQENKRKKLNKRSLMRKDWPNKKLIKRITTKRSVKSSKLKLKS
mgnify:CR=1 FL=1